MLQAKLCAPGDVSSLWIDILSPSVNDATDLGNKAVLAGHLSEPGHDARQTYTGQVVVQPEAARTGFLHELQAAAAGELLEQPAGGILLCAHGTRINNRCIVSRIETGSGDGVLVHIESDENSGIVYAADLRGAGIAEVSAWPRESHTVWKSQEIIHASVQKFHAHDPDGICFDVLSHVPQYISAQSCVV